LTIGKNGFETYVIRKNSDYTGLNDYEIVLLKGLFGDTLNEQSKNEKIFMLEIQYRFYSSYKSSVKKFEDEFAKKEFFVQKSFFYTRKFKKIAKVIIWIFSIFYLKLLLILKKQSDGFCKILYVYRIPDRRFSRVREDHAPEVKYGPDFETREKGSFDRDYGNKTNQSPDEYSGGSKSNSGHDYGYKGSQSSSGYSGPSKGSSSG
jgi:hypothetical protein